MASSSSFFLFFLLVSCLALEAAAGRDVPTDTDSKMSFDGTVWIPGLGRYMVPKKGSKSLDYNPITGAPGGNGLSIPGFGGSTGGRNYIPGGDDTFVPNPGTEVPVSGGGGIPTPSSP
ncbi:putative cell wall protein [Salvia divinorum]|uniref:Cell wall protein n=1 Tax=Salvia divinorum TaxID=28513 RepID=A0ABD1IG33_SALDI